MFITNYKYIKIYKTIKTLNEEYIEILRMDVKYQITN